ncbi:N-acetyltransferase family protein [Thioalkalivibrio sp.]|uniref:GNAT family N-acetyltransferase n=1 Tax=Thioalkalivibrio sp. TaxID=2093813 RepID=UPI003976D7E3
MSNVIAMPRLVIRPGTETDRDAVVALVSGIWRETYALHLPPESTPAPEAAHIPDLVGDPAERGWVATLGDRVIGYGSVTANCVDQIWVPAPMRRRGIGSAILDRAIKDIRERGFTFAQAGCEDFNQPARQFLEAKGWHLIASQPQPLGDGRSCNALVFSRPLT